MKRIQLPFSRKDKVSLPDETTNILKTILLFVALTGMVSCSEDNPNPAEPVKTNTVNVDLPADPGEIGLVISAREVFRNGFIATEASVRFPGHSELDTTLAIDNVTNVAILKIPNENLTQSERDELTSGVEIEIDVYNESKDLLESYTNDRQQLDDRNIPLTIPATQARNLPPILLREGVPYYIQPLVVVGDDSFSYGEVLKPSNVSDRQYTVDPLVDNETHFRFFFEPVPGSDTYRIRGIYENSTVSQPQFYLSVVADIPSLLNKTENVADALEFSLEYDNDGWVKIREVQSGFYVFIARGSSTNANLKALRLFENEYTPFRFISADITWAATDRGTRYSQSIIPAAKIEFAYAATIKNCSEGLLTEEVGVIKERTSTRTMQTTESLQFFAGATYTAGITTGLSAGVSIPTVGDVSASVEISASLALTTNLTTGRGTTETAENIQSSTVSRVRTLEIPPFTGVEVFDAVRVVKGARVPFTQQVRITGKYGNGTELTSGEILTQMELNFVSAVPLAIGPNYVDVGVAGYVTINEMFETETGIEEIVDACK